MLLKVLGNWFYDLTIIKNKEYEKKSFGQLFTKILQLTFLQNYLNTKASITNLSGYIFETNKSTLIFTYLEGAPNLKWC